MCYWGFAHACGPNLNEPHKTPAELRAGQLAASQAAQLWEQSQEIYSAKEQVKGWEVFIRSMAERYRNDDADAQRYTEQLRSLREKMLGSS
eukprot:Skav228261  [mRNA]  locus=scaffold3031:175272:175890:+ [translate_table: standard]